MVDVRHSTKDENAPGHNVGIVPRDKMGMPELKPKIAKTPKDPALGVDPPTLTELQPTSAALGAPDLELHVIGENFTNNCMITFARRNKQTTFHSDTELSCIIQPTEATIPPGKASVTVKDGSFETAELEFLFTAPDASELTLTAITPSSAEIGGPDLTLHATGTGFTAESKLTFNGGDETTVFVSGTELTTGIKPSTASVAGSYPVTVKRGDEETDPQTFTFTAAAGATSAKKDTAHDKDKDADAKAEKLVPKHEERVTSSKK